jgi:hypothetical protein
MASSQGRFGLPENSLTISAVAALDLSGLTLFLTLIPTPIATVAPIPTSARRIEKIMIFCDLNIEIKIR